MIVIVIAIDVVFNIIQYVSDFLTSNMKCLIEKHPLIKKNTIV